MSSKIQPSGEMHGGVADDLLGIRLWLYFSKFRAAEKTDFISFIPERQSVILPTLHLFGLHWLVLQHGRRISVHHGLAWSIQSESVVEEAHQSREENKS